MSTTKYDKERYDFALFLTMTKKERMTEFGYERQKDFAEAYGIAFEKTLSEWKRQPKFKKLHRDLLMERLGKRLPDALNSFERRAIDDGDVTALKEYLKIMDLSRDKLEIVSGDDIALILETTTTILQEELKDFPEILNKIAQRMEDEIEV